jgi:hypothetical protein
VTRGFLLAAKTFVVPRTHRKLSWIWRPLIKSLWFGDTRRGSTRAKWLASALEKIPKLWMRLIGR